MSTISEQKSDYIMQKPDSASTATGTAPENPFIEEALRYKEKLYLLKEKFNILKKHVKAEARAKLETSQQIKNLQEDNARLKKELRLQKQGKSFDGLKGPGDQFKANPSFLPGLVKRNESLWMENESSVSELESLKVKLLKAENDVEALRNENRKFQKDVEVIVAQLRTISSENLLMKTRMESAVAEKVLSEKKASCLQDELLEVRQRTKELQVENDSLSSKNEQCARKIDELSLKVISPHDVYYAYQIKKISYIGVEDMLMILRFKLNKEIVLQFESRESEVFEIKFKDIKSIEKSVKTLNQIRITLKTLFNQTFDFEVKNRQKVLEDIKKFWKVFLADPERPQEQDFDVYEKIKSIFFDA